MHLLSETAVYKTILKYDLTWEHSLLLPPSEKLTGKFCFHCKFIFISFCLPSSFPTGEKQEGDEAKKVTQVCFSQKID